MDKSNEIEYTKWLQDWESVSRLHPIYHYAGPWDAPIVVVGQREKGVALPFITKYGTRFAWEGFMYLALVVGWTYAQEIPPQHLRSKNGIISCGEKTSKWLRYHVDGEAEILQLPTPKYFLTQQSTAEIAAVYDSVREFIENHI